MSERLDRIETKLETVKEILVATARRAEEAQRSVKAANDSFIKIEDKVNWIHIYACF